MNAAGRSVARSTSTAVVVVALAVVVWQISPTLAQRQLPPPVGAITAGDWPLHNLDLNNGRYSMLDQITRSNAGALTLRWSFDLPNKMSVGTATPLVVRGVMYINSGGTLFALDAATGKQLWTEVVRSTEVNPGGAVARYTPTAESTRLAVRPCTPSTRPAERPSNRSATTASCALPIARSSSRIGADRSLPAQNRLVT